MRSTALKSLAGRCALAVLGLAAMLFASPARAEVVFGNLGDVDQRTLGTTSTDLIPESWLAQGFSTGTSSRLDLASLTLGLSSVTGTNVTVSIFSDASGLPGSSIWTSSPTLVTGTAKFSFSSPSMPSLTAGTSYWIVPNGAKWFYVAGTPASPSQQNGSGYQYLGLSQGEGNTPLPSGPWTAPITSGGITRYAVSINAVPEPSTLALAGIGVAALGGLELRRRSRRNGGSK